jgi:hypothetical protein
MAGCAIINLQKKAIHMKFIKSGTLLLSLQLLIFPAAILLLSALFFLIGIAVTAISFWISLIIAVVIPILIVKKNKHFRHPEYFTPKKLTRLTTIFIAILMFSMLISIWVYDFSSDGQGYHQAGVIALTEGWNPVHQPDLGSCGEAYKAALGQRIKLINHYPKASWITAAVIFKVTGSIEAGKMFHWLYMVAVFLMMANLLSHLKNIPWQSKIILSVLTALNPVVLYQWSGYYNDSQLASLTVLLLILASQHLMFRDPKASIYMAITLLILCNIKFTGLVYALVILLVAWIVVRIIDKNWQIRFLKFVAAGFLIAILFIGFQPYIINTVKQGNPFYPAIDTANPTGSNIIQWQAPQDFIKKNRFSKLFLSLFGQSDNHLQHWPSIKIPLSIDGFEIEVFKNADVRYGGFGPLFGAVLLTLMLGIYHLFASKRLIPVFTMFIFGMVLVSVLVNPESWWARLAPQLWFLPIPLIVSFYYVPPRDYILYLRGFAISILLLNTFIVMHKHAAYTLKTNTKFRAQMTRLAEQSKDGRKIVTVYPAGKELAVWNRLKHFDIKFKIEHTPPEGLKGKRLIGTPGARIYIDLIDNSLIK